jgi:hypothetical protein
MEPDWQLLLKAAECAEKTMRNASSMILAVQDARALLDRIKQCGVPEGARYSWFPARVLLELTIERCATLADTVEEHELSMVIGALVPVVKRHAGKALIAARARPTV